MLPWKQVGVVVMCMLLVEVTALNVSADDTNNTYFKDILMRGAKPLKPDAYLCRGYEVEEDEAYIVEFEAEAFADTAHHILIYGCEYGPASSKDFWNCPAICRGGRSQIMFAWAKNAPPTHLPKGVGLKVGQKTSIKTIVMQIHYARAFKASDSPDRSGIRLHISRERQRYVAGVFLLMSYNFAVPPNQTKYHVDVSCRYDKRFTMFPFAYRTHAHGLGRVITGYQHNVSGYHLIGKGNPQWPQAFYPSNASIAVKPGDDLVARCTYNSVGINHTVEVGATGNDEMCNFYIMFYTDSSVAMPSGQCGGVDSQSLVDNLPKGSDVTLPPQPWMEDEAKGHHHHHHHAMPSSHRPHPSGGTPAEPAASLPGRLQYQRGWPTDRVVIGQVSGVATDHQGNVYVFHRGDRVWNASLFRQDNSFKAKDQPIQQDTVLILTPDGHLIRKFGRNRHFMPQGMEVDNQGNMWLTDIALHQVFRIPAGGTEPNLVLGERFVSGRDDAHFCQPTDVAVMSSGEFFVSDGLCNSRILKFSPEGRLLKQWGEKSPAGSVEPGPGQFSIPHSVSVAPGHGLLCVADSGHATIQCFDPHGHFRFSIRHPQFGPALCAVDCSPGHGGLLYAVSSGEGQHMKGFTFSLPSHTLLETWTLPAPRSLTTPGDVAVDARGHVVYVGEQSPPAVRKFVRRFANDTNDTITTTSTTTTTTVTITTSAATTTSISSTTTAPTLPTPTTTTPPTSTTTTIPDVHNQTGAGNREHPGGESVDKSQLTGKAKPNSTDGEGKSVDGEGQSHPSVQKAEKEVGGLAPLVLVGPLVAVPLFILMVVVIVRHQNKQGVCTCCHRAKTYRGVSLSDRLKNARKGFDPLLQHLSEDSDSENEMFLQPTKNGIKQQKE